MAAKLSGNGQVARLFLIGIPNQPVAETLGLLPKGNRMPAPLMPASTSLPIWKIHDDILNVVRTGNRLVLVAPTGSGKTTQVPQMLLDAGIAGEKMIVVLQPRRVAARTVATRVAWEREGKLGDEVGYQIRFDDHTSVGTRICFVTEGILLRWLQDDRTLGKIGAVVFDEFHERNLLQRCGIGFGEAFAADAAA